MSLTDLVVSRLTTATTPWTDVKQLADLSLLDMQSSGNRKMTLFVFLQHETPGPDIRGSGPYLQSVTAAVGVVIAAKVVNGQQFDFAPARQALREKLFGWTPSDGFEPLWLGAGRLLNIQRGQASWLDTFVTEYTEDQNRYGA